MSQVWAAAPNFPQSAAAASQITPQLADLHWAARQLAALAASAISDALSAVVTLDQNAAMQDDGAQQAASLTAVSDNILYQQLGETEDCSSNAVPCQQATQHGADSQQVTGEEVQQPLTNGSDCRPMVTVHQQPAEVGLLQRDNFMLTSAVLHKHPCCAMLRTLTCM